MGRPVAAGGAPKARPLHFGAEPLFGWYHPAGGGERTGAGVVLCSPVGDDYVRAHGPLRHLAERLAAVGFDVLRFDFHGTGDSADDERALGRAAAWRRDIGTAIDTLRVLGGVGPVALVGLRFGATLAAVVAAARGDIDSLVLWSPYPGGADFVADAIRTHAMYRMLEPQSLASGPRTRVDGDEALGFFLTREASADLRDVDLHALRTLPAPAALVVGAVVARDQRIVQHLTSLGVACAYFKEPADKFLVCANHLSPLPDEILDHVTGWLAGRHAPARGRGLDRDATPDGAPPASRSAGPALAARVVEGSSVEEQPLVFGGGQRLFGILTRPAAERVRSGRPAVLLLNAGTVHHVGPHRLYVSMARRWAELGFFVLRLDLSGIGDSPAPPGGLENLCYPPDAARQVDLAMRAVSAATGADRFVLAGLCSGGDIVLSVGSEDRRVVSAVMMNPRTFTVTNLQEIEQQQDARHYWGALLKRASWVKLLHGEVDLPRATRLVKDVALRKLKDLGGAAGEDGKVATPDAASRLRSMVERGVDTLLVVTEHDPGVDYVDAHYGEAMRALGSLQGFRREDVPGTDHTFTSLWAQSHVSDVVTAHLLGRQVEHGWSG